MPQVTINRTEQEQQTYLARIHAMAVVAFLLALGDLCLIVVTWMWIR